MGWYRPYGPPPPGARTTPGGLVWRDAVGPSAAGNKPDEAALRAALPGMGAIARGDIDDGRAAMLRGRDGAAEVLHAEARGQLTMEQCRARVGTARERVHRRKGG